MKIIQVVPRRTIPIYFGPVMAWEKLLIHLPIHTSVPAKNNRCKTAKMPADPPFPCLVKD